MFAVGSRNSFSSHRASGGLTSSFKNIPRDKNAAWGNRFVRDHNDLDYEANPQSIANRIKKTSKNRKSIKANDEDQSPMRKYEYSPFKQRQQVKTSQSTRNLHAGLNPNLYIKEMKDYQSKRRIGLETAPSSSKRKTKKQQPANVEVKPFNQYGIGMQTTSQQFQPNCIEIADSNNNQFLHKRNSKQLNLLGLSPFEFDETIQGKMLRKSNHHIDFERSSTNKIDNRNRVWYDYSKDIQKSGSLLEKQKQATLRKVHPFKSYSAHKLFAMPKNMSIDNGCGNGGMLDKFYSIISPDIYELTHQNYSKRHTNYQKMKPRSPLPVKLGTNLDYNTQELKSVGLGNNKRPILDMNQTERKLVFSRQVISPKRGCFR